MRQFIRFLVVIITIAVLVGTVYYLFLFNDEYKLAHPEQSGEKIASSNNIEKEEKAEKSEAILESKEVIEKYAEEEKASLISSIKSTINMNIIANVRKSMKATISLKEYNNIISYNANDKSGELTSGDSSGEDQRNNIPNEIPCTIQIAGSMIYIVPEDKSLDSMEFHYRGDNKLMAYVREYAGTSVKATYYFENGKLLSEEVNSFDSLYNVFEDENEILTKADKFYKSFLAE